MRDSNRPSGPGKPIEERIDAVEEVEDIDETVADREGDAEALDDSGRRARHADRDASVPDQGSGQSGGSRGG